MGPIPGIVNSARTLALYAKLQEVTANNIANANTPGFKADRLTAALLGQDEMQTPVPIRSVDLAQGPFRETGRSLDVGLDGQGFLVVQTPQGERLIRGGSLKLDGAGQLTDGEGNVVQGDGGPLVLTGGEVEIRTDGSVLAGGASVGRLRVVTVADPASLLKEAAGRFIASEPLQPVEGVQVRQGAIEEANLDPIRSMVDMITIQRAFAANMDALKAMDSILGAVTSEVGKV